MKARPHPILIWLLAGALGGLFSSTSSAQEPGETVTVVAGPRYNAGGLHRLVFGSGYRDMWTAPIEVPVLDLRTEAGGLEPVMVVGNLQTLGLALRGADGRAYTFRAVHKDMVRILPEELRDTAIADVAQDLLSAGVPAGEIAAIPLAAAAGVRQPISKLVVMPDVAELGEFREQFSGLLGTLAEYPTASESGGTFGATMLVDGDEVWELLTASPEVRIDAREFLRARLVDQLLGDWDRHVGQWRFARIPGHDLLVPISEDRDQAFAQYEGLALKAARDREPKLSDFGPEFSSLEGSGWNARTLDRRLLTGLSRDVWREVAREIQTALTDQVIEDSLRRFPAPYYANGGETLAAAFKARRDRLVEQAERTYEFLAGEVNVFATDVAELVRIERRADGTTAVSVAEVTGTPAGDCAPPAAAPYYERTFRRGETKSIRIYTGAGDDRVLLVGDESSGPKTHVVGGGGSNLICDSSSGRTLAFDISDADDSGPGTKIAGNLWVAPSETIAAAGTPADSQGAALAARRDWGSTRYMMPFFGYGPDIGPFIGQGMVIENYSFRNRPYSTQHQIRAGFAVGVLRPRIDYAGIYRLENRSHFFVVRALASGVESLRYYGFGNETEELGDDDFYRVQQSTVGADIRVAFSAGTRATLTTGPVVRWTRTETDEDDFIATDAPYGSDDLGQVGWTAGFNFNSRERPGGRPMKGSDDALRFGPSPLGVGYTLDVDAQYYPKAWDLRESYGLVRTEATAAYLLGPRGPAIGFRIGGASTWGDTPYYDAAYLGSDELRGLRPNRFAGKQSVYANSTAYIHVGRLNLFLPGRWGVLGRGGVGRVWLEDDGSKVWHTSFGGGLWWAPWDLQNVLRLEVSKSDEATIFYALLGFEF